VRWLSGSSELSPCTIGKVPLADQPEFQKWQDADNHDRLRLYLEIPKSTLKDLPNTLEIVRHTSTGADLPVASLPNLRSMLLPYELTIESLGSEQFTLRGENASVIDAVALQNGQKSYMIPAATGTNFALFTVTAQSSSKNPTASSSGPPTVASVTTDSTGRKILISGQNFGDQIGSVLLDNVRAKTVSQWSTTSVTVEMPDGKKVGDTIKIQLLPFQKSSSPVDFIVGKTITAQCKSSDTSTPCITQISLDATNNKVTILGTNFGDPIGTVTFGAVRSTVLAWGKESVTTAIPAGVTIGKTLNVAVLPAQQRTEVVPFAVGASPAPTKNQSAIPNSGSANSGTDSSANDIPAGTYAVLPLMQVRGSGATVYYLPLDVTDAKGKSLTFTIAPAKKQDANPQTTTAPSNTPACTAQCILPSCTQACPPAQAPIPKTQ
jgi:hypothetical protein